MSNEVADTLREGLGVLRERGWFQRGESRRRSAGYACALIALAGHRTLNDDAVEVFADVIREQWPDRWVIEAPVRENSTCLAITDFNDHPDTTQDDVERAFEKAICRAEEMGL